MPYALKVLTKHWPNTPKHTDILTLFALAGLVKVTRSRANGGGLESKTSGLFWQMARILRIFTPTWFLGENVPGLLSVNEGKDFCTVLAELQNIGYGLSWRILDSQYFGVAQRRRRLFIVGRFREPCPPQILFEPESHRGYHPQIEEAKQQRGLCLSTRDGARQDPSTENLICSTIRSNWGVPTTPRGQFIGYCLKADQGQQKAAWEQSYVAQVDTEGKREIARVPEGLDSLRGVIIGNAVTVPVAEYIGKRIMDYERKLKLF